MRSEFLKYGREVLTQTLQTSFKVIFDSEDIPHQWKISMLINIGKGKKDSEKLENKRGISLCNNINKLFGKIIVNRMNKHLNFTEAQAVARPQKSTLNNLFTIKSIIQQRKHEGKTYEAFIDIEKAYDKVWSNATFYYLWNRRIKGKLWRIMYKLDRNLKTTIATKFGQTDTIDIEDRIRQGRPLLGLEFALLIDQPNVDIKAEGYGIISSHLIIVSLLFMDDIILIADSEKQIQEILNQTNLFFNKWHLKLNLTKSAVVIFHRKQANKTQN